MLPILRLLCYTITITVISFAGYNNYFSDSSSNFQIIEIFQTEWKRIRPVEDENIHRFLLKGSVGTHHGRRLPHPVVGAKHESSSHGSDSGSSHKPSSSSHTGESGDKSVSSSSSHSSQSSSHSSGNEGGSSHKPSSSPHTGESGDKSASGSSSHSSQSSSHIEGEKNSSHSSGSEVEDGTGSIDSEEDNKNDDTADDGVEDSEEEYTETATETEPPEYAETETSTEPPNKQKGKNKSSTEAPTDEVKPMDSSDGNGEQIETEEPETATSTMKPTDAAESTDSSGGNDEPIETEEPEIATSTMKPTEVMTAAFPTSVPVSEISHPTLITVVPTSPIELTSSSQDEGDEEDDAYDYEDDNNDDEENGYEVDDDDENDEEYNNYENDEEYDNYENGEEYNDDEIIDFSEIKITTDDDLTKKEIEELEELVEEFAEEEEVLEEEYFGEIEDDDMETYTTYDQKPPSSEISEAYPLITSPPVEDDDKVNYDDVDDFEVEYPTDQNENNNEEQKHYDPSQQQYNEPYIPPTDDEGGLTIPDIEEIEISEAQEAEDEEESEVEAAVEKTTGIIIPFMFLFMIFTAYQMSENPDGVYASICRLCISMVVCVCNVLMLPFKILLGNRFGSSGNSMFDTPDYREPYRNRHGHIELS